MGTNLSTLEAVQRVAGVCDPEHSVHFNWFLGVDGYKVGHPPLGPRTCGGRRLGKGHPYIKSKS